MDWSVFLPPVLLSLQTAVIASIIVFVLALVVARFMARRRFRGQAAVDTLLLLPLVLPPTVVGFVLLVLLSARGPAGRLAEELLGRTLLFTPAAAVVAAAIVAFPLAYSAMRSGFEAVDRELEDAARSLGASEWQVLRHVSIPLASRALLAGYVLGFARGLGEFGATLMIAGSIPGRTQTLPTAIYLAVDAGRTGMAWAWTVAIVAVSFLMLALSGFIAKSQA